MLSVDIIFYIIIKKLIILRYRKIEVSIKVFIPIYIYLTKRVIEMSVNL